MQAACDHQVENQPEIVVEADGNALADTAKLAHGVTLGVGERRLHRAKQKRAGYPHALEWLPKNARFEGRQVCADVRKLGHRSRLQAKRENLQANGRVT